jgi:hypothetical protein
MTCIKPAYLVIGSVNPLHNYVQEPFTFTVAEQAARTCYPPVPVCDVKEAPTFMTSQTGTDSNYLTFPLTLTYQFWVLQPLYYYTFSPFTREGILIRPRGHPYIREVGAIKTCTSTSEGTSKFVNDVITFCDVKPLSRGTRFDVYV